MDVEKETRIEYDAITIFIIIIAILVVGLIIGLASNLLELKADSSALAITSHSATQNSLTFTLKNEHSNDLFVKSVTVDGKMCQLCAESHVVKEDSELVLSCGNINHENINYQHTIAVEFGDRKGTYTLKVDKSVNGVAQDYQLSSENFASVYEKVFITKSYDETVTDVISNSCPQIIVTGARSDENNDFDLILYSFSSEGNNQQQKTWDLNTFDTGSAVTQDEFGKTYLFGHTYNQFQGADTLLLETDDYKESFFEKISGTSRSENAKDFFIDSDNYRYTIVELSDNPKQVLIQKKDVNTELMWENKIDISGFETYLTGTLKEDELYIAIANKDGKTSKLIIYNTIGQKIQQREIPFIIRHLTFDNNNFPILVGAVKTQATSDAIVAKYSINWNKLWSKTWGGTDNEVYVDAHINSDNTIFTIGTFEIGTNNFRSFLHVYNTAGEQTKSHLFKAPQSLKITDLELSSDGLYAIGEAYDGAQNDIYIAKFK